MPFTPSHAVVALPFLRTPLAPAAVAVGAMSPDLPLFVPGTPLDYATTHDLARLPLTLCVALVLLLVWRMLLRPAARELSPRAIARRLPAAWDGGAVAGLRETFARRGARHPSWAGVALLVAALAIGVVSHVVWDEFTHEGRWGTTLVPALAGQWGPWPGYRWMQYGSSVVGLAALAAAALVWLRRSVPDAAPVPRLLPAWARAAWLASLVVAAVVGVVALAPAGPEFTPTYLAYRILVPVCAGWAVLRPSRAAAAATPCCARIRVILRTRIRDTPGMRLNLPRRSPPRKLLPVRPTGKSEGPEGLAPLKRRTTSNPNLSLREQGLAV